MRRIVALVLFFMLIATAAFAETRIRMASTTSTQNSGLFDYLLPLFEKKAGIKIDVVAVGTGASIEIGKRGDADVVFVHAKEQELKAVEEGFFVNRHDVMYNDFVIIGPPSDPAKVKGMKSAADALKAIAHKAIARKTGARGLRSIMESILLEPMFELPGLEGVESMVISRDVIDNAARPLYIYTDRREDVGSSA
jgi:ABC-type tungstate transport system permease subunit